MVKEILTYDKNKDILIQKSEPVIMITDEIKNIIQDLKDTLEAHPEGAGISAVQIGELKRICVIKYNNQIYTLINPVIAKTRGEIDYVEGCLSVPSLSTNVKRFQKVWCIYLDEEGKERELSDGGLCSIIIQHELDHFRGECPLFAAYEEAYKDEQN